MLKFLERAEWLFEMGIPGAAVGIGVTLYSAFTHEASTALIGTGITLLSLCLIELGRRYRDKVPDHEL